MVTLYTREESFEQMHGGSYAICGFVSTLSFGETSTERACVHATLRYKILACFWLLRTKGSIFCYVSMQINRKNMK